MMLQSIQPTTVHEASDLELSDPLSCSLQVKSPQYGLAFCLGSVDLSNRSELLVGIWDYHLPSRRPSCLHVQLGHKSCVFLLELSYSKIFLVNSLLNLPE